jgi:hypothetical protein
MKENKRHWCITPIAALFLLALPGPIAAQEFVEWKDPSPHAMRFGCGARILAVVVVA